MTKCDVCGQESGRLVCGRCRTEILKEHNLVRVLVYDRERKGYRAGCLVLQCPWNELGVCKVVVPSIEFLKLKLHEFDGDNIVRQECG